MKYIVARGRSESAVYQYKQLHELVCKENKKSRREERNKIRNILLDGITYPFEGNVQLKSGILESILDQLKKGTTQKAYKKAESWQENDL